MWSENIANDINAKYMAYAVGHSPFSLSLDLTTIMSYLVVWCRGQWLTLAEQAFNNNRFHFSRFFANLVKHISVFLTHCVVSRFLSQSNDLDPHTTLYTVFFGIK